ncbi:MULTISPECIES: Co2+/Mg2+ efflux protein ApaG [Hymenobacter]|jgi:ApaG protein|uniref:Protein ApaG n=3 Tax=Hymenobacter TaxID=89966 RepID=A0A6M6BD03_9BACT|nr:MULTISPECIES: Co2+/Mg2+ efflux protein ApaG [Hymenobacter]QJX45708.1 Co2+/Mg2+ efflux protein ApaG [Hymenobacter taeanensis]TGD78845.1 Co2+/Mg2+ efflux protein ApaG [Hymenobacter wooponensis]TGE10455.1 Co2+/Mg2+ efflux protein ApaG [Hymenobacter fodinae]UOQ79546.1 Co2+/Mg2+ efflux protein ApaG [Hymenobacter sp. 5414T-23]
MNTTTTQGVTVSVTTNYLPDYSSPGQEHYVFAYKIDIRNDSEFTVKLLRRHWYIYDANGAVREVEGEGVVGQQPVLEPGESHQYVSGCNLKSGLGKMRGSYQMERLMDGSEFAVEIPEFTLVVPYRLN